MKNRTQALSLSLLTSACLLALLFLLVGAIQPARARGSQLNSRRPPLTTITVNSSKDLNTSMSETCLSKTPCTLRRAIVQARNVEASQRPVLINFNISQEATENYDAALGIWKIPLLTTSDASVLRRINGQIIIDGSTQPGGRSDGPKIILVGPGSTGNKDGLVVGDVAGNDENEIRGLGFQNFKTHMYLNTNNNLIENNWFGLNDEGTAPYLRNNNPQDGSGNTGISVSDASSNNLIQNNVFLGLDGVAAAINGEQNTFKNNYVGTAADGTTPGKVTDPDLICTSDDWLGGGGISISGVIYGGINHRIENNIFAGLRQEIFAASTQPEAISVHGTYHLIQHNQIGVDSQSHEVGVCGRGIYLIGSPHDMQVISNTIVDTGLSALSLNDPLYDAVLLRYNTVEKTQPWIQVTGKMRPESAIQINPSLPDPFEFFIPAEITSISGTAVSGTNGAGSPCPNCVIEVFLDDTDTITEALKSLAMVTANGSGNWQATLPDSLNDNQGLRTTSTTAKMNTISNISSGTTSGLSELYIEADPPPVDTRHKVYLPLARR
jgi:hypothetical protein